MEQNIDILEKGIKRTEKFLTRDILMDDINAGKTELLETAYTQLGLYGNLRIIEKEKNCIKSANNISDHIYEDILEVIMEEIFKKHNMEALDLLIGHYRKRFPGIERLVDYDGTPELFLEYLNNSPSPSCYTRTKCTILYYLLYGKDIVNKTIIVCRFKDILYYSGFMELFRDSGSQLEAFLKIKCLESRQPYKDFLSRQRKALTDFLGINYGGLEKFVLNTVYPCKDSCRTTPKNYASKNLEDILTRNAISITGAIKQDEKKCLDIIKLNFVNLCNSMLLLKYCCLEDENPETALNEAIAETSIEQPHAFLISLVASFCYGLLAMQLKGFMEKECERFSIGHPEGGCLEQGLASENACLKAEIEKLKEDLKKKEDAYNALSRKHAKEAKKARHDYAELERYLKRQLEEQKKLNQKLQENISKNPCHTGNLNEDANTAEDSCEADMDISRIADKKILFLGGRPSIIKKLKKIFRNALFIGKNSSSFPDKVDMTVILAEAISHSLTDRFYSSNNGSLVIESHSTNVDMIIHDMLLYS